MSNRTKDKELEKGLMKVLDGLKEIRHDLEEKAEKRTWREINVPSTLYDVLSRFTKDELTNIRKTLTIPNASSLKKVELIKLLETKIPEKFETICLHFDVERYSIIDKLAHQGGSVDAAKFSLDLLKNLEQYGLIFTGTNNGEKVAVMPSELVERFQTINHTKLKTITKRNTEWIKLAQGLLYYYGTLSGTTLIRMVEKYSDYNMDVKNFFDIMHDAVDCYNEIRVDGNGFSQGRVFDSGRVVKEHRSRKDVPYYPFTKEQLLDAGVPNYVERNSSYRQFVTFLTQNYEVSKKEADGFAEECVYATRIGDGPQDVLQFLQQSFEIDSLEKVQAFMEPLVNLMNNTREWFLKGYTSTELLEIDKKHMQPLPNNTNNVIDFKTKKKVGRNDPCPCGSGKKYKKCCGR
ncbi:SEC-C metal-binding domain-containing protein [Virgibacillus oceani]|uniref:Preprotein translocase subunit SecA n=1 Tax=Virgibacillus oceani TaxID=1479511 RepID=A0A917M5B2_9BACI|nr:SEC-C metal-binding domain-containing protein [Virgibacillus oceani]GGG78365.1 preprotein translocase subunit SecA [Virgibacillus oceani]